MKFLQNLYKKIADFNKKESDEYKKYLQTGRNELCPCGSGKKFKNCHINKYANSFKPIKIFLKVFHNLKVK